MEKQSTGDLDLHVVDLSVELVRSPDPVKIATCTEEEG